MPPPDPLEWAKHPKSQAALHHIRRHMKHDRRLKAIFDELVEIKACTAAGGLLCRWNGHRWVNN